MSVVDALLAVAGSDRGAAIAAAERAARDEPDALLPAALAAFVRDGGRDGVYEEPTAFERFIGGGTNPELYRRTIDALTAIHRRTTPTSVLDIGCGDGRVTAAVLADAARVDLVEPSAELLAAATTSVRGAGHDVASHALGIDDFLAAHPDRRWATVQSTFALSAVEPTTRRAMLADLVRRTDRLLVVDFDVPVATDRSEAHARYVAGRYEDGLAEYADDPEVVTGFLLPVLVGQFDPTRSRPTHEQSAQAWVAELTEAGFTVDVTEVSPYWWATARLFDARVS